ncbi:ABC transporter substrate-binding protein [Natranaerobius trueperi]|uniref:ABC transporter substrate-binding protein n=1 Tax=Natranaerobius trueperi TaxID=759412 RepID=A0A226BWP8_9FIRM|nr:ABC transporter substrate-binding protein [Natranaerobius trueperi]OWZ83202.1 ABC transporter substrate-binding protein [Natranaerobius trueperi]
MIKPLKLLIIVLLALTTTFIFMGCGEEDPVADKDEPEEERIVPELTLHTTTMEFDPGRNEAALMIQENMEELGFKVDVRPLEHSTLVDRARRAPGEKDWHGLILGWSGRIERIDPDMFTYTLFHSSQAVQGGNNFHAYQDDEFDEIAKAQRKAMDTDERQELIYEAQEKLAEDAPMYVLYYVEGLNALNTEKWDEDTMIKTPEGLYNEWLPFYGEPLTDDSELRIGGLQDLDTVNPYAATSVFEWKLLRLVYDKLVRVGPGLEPKPWAAEDFEVSEEGDQVDVSLRDDMTFHDGKPVTPDDVVFTFENMIDVGVPYFEGFLDPIDQVELLEDDTIRFELEDPYAPFLTNTLGQIPILPKHIWEDIEEEENLSHPDEYENIPVIGSGPFEFSDWQRGEYLQIEKYEEYFEADEIDMDGINYIIYGHEEGQFGGLEQEAIEMVAEGFESDYVDRVDDIDHLELKTHPSIGLNYMSLNNSKPPFDDKAVRHAMGHLINHELLIDVLQDGYAMPGGAGRVISPANDFWRNPDVEEYEFDMDKARSILEEAGYEWDSEGRIYYPE